MKKTREDIFADVITLLQDLASDWDYSSPMGPSDSSLF